MAYSKVTIPNSMGDSYDRFNQKHEAPNQQHETPTNHWWRNYIYICVCISKIKFTTGNKTYLTFGMGKIIFLTTLREEMSLAAEHVDQDFYVVNYTVPHFETIGFKKIQYSIYAWRSWDQIPRGNMMLYHISIQLYRYMRVVLNSFMWKTPSSPEKKFLSPNFGEPHVYL